MTKTTSDLIVVGSGVAGLSAALSAADAGATVTVLTATDTSAGSSWRAQGGIAAALGDDDTPQLHAEDTLAVGAGLNDPHMVDLLVTQGRTAVRDLIASGVPFDSHNSRPDLGQEAGHQRRRIVHAQGAATGVAVTTVLSARVARHPRIKLLINSPVDSLLTNDRGVMGALCGGTPYLARAVLLATGGYASIFGRTTNTPATTGHGLGLAWRVGATLANLEFVQFHPTALDIPNHSAYLLSEALRGEGALIVDDRQREIADPMLPRDLLAREIHRHRQTYGPVYLTLRHLDHQSISTRFASLAQYLRAWGFDLAHDLLPIAPAAHYCMGGIRTDDRGRTDVGGLYAAGEVACTGAQGANRLASNSLLECLVFGRLAAEAAIIDSTHVPPTWQSVMLPSDKSACVSFHGDMLTNATDGQTALTMDSKVGVERDGRTLAAAYDCLAPDPDRRCQSLSAMVTMAALMREESRGAHCRVDFPDPDPQWQGHILWRKGAQPRLERIAS